MCCRRPKGELPQQRLPRDEMPQRRQRGETPGRRRTDARRPHRRKDGPRRLRETRPRLPERRSRSAWKPDTKRILQTARRFDGDLTFAFSLSPPLLVFPLRAIATATSRARSVPAAKSEPGRFPLIPPAPYLLISHAPLRQSLLRLRRRARRLA